MAIGAFLHLLISVSVVYLLIAAGEYGYHRHIAHGMPPHWLRLIPFWGTRCKKHMLHHFLYYRIFNFEPDPVGRYHDLKVTLLTSFLVISLLTVPAYLIDHFTGWVALAGGILHSILFNRIHSEIHLSEIHPATIKRLRRFAVFRHWECHHFLHHRHPEMNFDAVAPLFDWLLGTHVEPTSEDLALMRQELGYDCRSVYRKSTESTC